MSVNDAWPACLGTFDEESCRFFLRELGQRMVQFYPFSVGMEEVFVQVIDEYGFEGAADALSVLHELLEDDCTAAGAGDDGDIWRSWRHAWRHRNDDRHNPYIPRARGRLLPKPTSTRIRLLKATNFVALQQPQAQWHESCSGRYAHRALSSVAEAQICDDRSPNTSTVSNQSLEEQGLLSTAHLRLRGSTTVSPRKSMPAPSRKHTLSFDFLSPRRRKSTTTSPTGRQSSDLKLIDAGGLVRHDSPVPNKGDAVSVDVTEKTPLSQRLFRMHENRYSLPSDVGSTDIEATPNRKRHVHRQARLIDGALFQSKSRKGDQITGGTLPQQSPVKVTGQNARSSWHSTQQSPRASWLHNIVTRLRGKQVHNTTQPRLREKHSSLDCGFGSFEPETQERQATTQPPTSIMPEMQHMLPAFGLDGAFDEHDLKPLPWSPADDRPRPSMQSELERMFASNEVEEVGLRSSTSLTSSSTTKLQEKDQLPSIVSGTMTGPKELSPIERALRYRFSSTSSHSAPSSPRTFTTFANKNPYRDSDEQPQIPFAQQHDTASTVWPFRDDNSTRTPTSDFNFAGISNGSASNGRGRKSPQHRRAATTEDGRGRRPATPPVTPSTARYDRPSPPKTPRPRSRSPAKKFIGMIKSMSTNQIPTIKTPSPPKATTPSSTNKSRWKDLSHKLRHGFLTADLEQLDQEELMEQYNANNTRSELRLVTPPSTHDRLTFPVSIKSSGQSKLWAELEYMLIETCNAYLKNEYERQRLSRDSVLKIKRQWQERNRPEVVEFYYDQTTQYELVISNLRSIQLYSDYSQDAMMLNSVLHQWKILVRELSVKTLCMPDSIVRRWLHDARRVLELLGAAQDVLVNMDKLTSLCMAVIGSAEKERAKKRQEENMGEIPVVHPEVPAGHRRSVSDGSQRTLPKHESALLHGIDGEAPPLPTPSSSSSGSRKPTPQELQYLMRRAQERKAATQGQQWIHGGSDRIPQEAKQFVFSAGTSPQNGSAQTRDQAYRAREERTRMYYD